MLLSVKGMKFMINARSIWSQEKEYLEMQQLRTPKNSIHAQDRRLIFEDWKMHKTEYRRLLIQERREHCSKTATESTGTRMVQHQASRRTRRDNYHSQLRLWQANRQNPHQLQCCSLFPLELQILRLLLRPLTERMKRKIH